MGKFFLGLTAAIALLAAPAMGQGIGRDARVNLRVEGRALSDVVQYLREQSGANIVVLEGADSNISLELTDVPWRDALEIAAEAADCVVEERTGGILVVERPARVTYETQGTDITQVIDLIAKLGGANIVVAPEVSGTLSLRLNNVPWRDALDVAVKTLGYVVVEENRGILRVVDPVTLQAQMITKSYQLRYLRPESKFKPNIKSEFMMPLLQQQNQQFGGQQDIEKSFTVLEALRKALSPGGELDYINNQNVIVVRDTVAVHDAIRDMINRLDTEPGQVFVDVKFVQTVRGELLDLGVDYGDTGPTASIGMGAIPITLPFELGDGGFEDGIIVNSSGAGPYADPTLNAGDTIIPDTVFGALDFTGVQATLRLLQRDSKTDVIQAPKLIVLDGTEGTIFVGETIRYAEAKSEQGQAGGLQLSLQEADGSPVDVGFQLLLVPHIIPGTNSMTMEIIPKETSLSGTGSSALAPAGFDVFTIGASGIEGSIALPRTRSSTILTTMLLESGQTAVIGGLNSESDIKRVSKVPGLAEIPILGELFTYRQKDRTRRNLMVFVTPTLVRSSADTERLLQTELLKRRTQLKDQVNALVDPEFAASQGTR
jgi:type IV pilus assembly protein PilQ